MKVCNRCKTKKPIERFTVCARSKGGHKASCRDCVNSQQQLRRISPEVYKLQQADRLAKKKAARLEKMNQAFRGRPHRQILENEVVEKLSGHYANSSMELLQLQDSTQDDVCDRPVGCKIDLWNPAQIKTTVAVVPPFFFKGMEKRYGGDVVCVAGASNVYSFSQEFIEEHAGSLSAGTVIEIGRTAQSKTYVFNSVEPVTMERLVDQRALKWEAEYAKYRNGQPSALRSEYDLRMRCPPKVQMEVYTMTCFKALHPECNFQWSGPGLPFDAQLDQRKAQFKVAGWNTRLKNATFVGQCHHRIGTSTMPYERSDADVFVFVTVHVRLQVYLEWTIPSDDMDRIFEVFSKRDSDGMFIEEGRQGIPLCIVGQGGENMALQMKIFGRQPRCDVDRRSSAFLKVFPLPDVAMPECMQGRDPVF